MAPYQNFNYIFYAAKWFLFGIFMYFNYILMKNMINLLSVLPYEPIEDYDK